MSGTVFRDLTTFVEACKEVDEWRCIEGVDWDQEIGALTEATAELIPSPPMLIFDRIRGYPPGFRVVSLLLASYRRFALALGLPHDKSRLELIRLAARKLTAVRPLPPAQVPDGPVMTHVLTGEAVDLLKFPAPRFHADDGGRYIGTGDSLINRDPDTGFLNMGTYRMQVHGPNLLGLWMSPGQQGRLICEHWWQRGRSCPVMATFGTDPVTFMVSQNKFPWGQSELEVAGGLLGEPLEVVEGPVTGLPIPAHAEIAIEGEVPPPEEERRDEGPFGEWPGYYAGGTLGTGEPQPVIRVKAVYHRSNPILCNQAPMWPGAPQFALRFESGVLWDQLERAGVQDVTGVCCYNPYLVVVAVRQRSPGHARQAGMATLGCAAAARNGRFVIVVDEDIDPTDFKEVLWAIQTRADPASDIQVVPGCWSTPLDPRMPPEKRAAGDYTNSRAVVYAVRPFPWRDRFPPVSRSTAALRRQIVDKYRAILAFPLSG